MQQLDEFYATKLLHSRLKGKRTSPARETRGIIAGIGPKIENPVLVSEIRIFL
jgi:hypothetical protein